VEERERRNKQERSREVLPAKKQRSAREKIRQREKEQRRKGNRISQGPLRKYRKLQGPDCKTKFPVDLNPK
jgi:hypothetical protein